MKKMNVKAVIMAGGFGTRIQPLTVSTPKPMLPVMNIPMMERVILQARDAGITEFVILLYYKPDVIKNYFKDGSKLGVNIVYVLPDDDYGTAGAVGFAREYLDTTFIILSGDVVHSFDLNKILTFHFQKKSKLTITLTSVENPLEFGVVITDKEGKIEKFLEKPSWSEVFSDTINTGIYVIEPEILNEIPKNTNFDFSKDLFPKLMQKGITLWGYNAKGYWRDVGNVNSYREVHYDIFDKKISWPFRGEMEKHRGAVVYRHPKCEIGKNVKFKGIVVLDKNVKIGDNVILENVTIGKNTTIFEESNIKNSIIWNNTKIGTHANIKNSVICNNVEIDENFYVKEGVVIAENVIINKNVTVEKDVTIWPNKIIESNAILSSNISNGHKYRSTLFNKGRVVGVINEELTSDMVLKLAEAYGSFLDEDSTVYVSRDYHKTSSMIKRIIIGGLLSVGINVEEVESVPSNVVRFALGQEKNKHGAIHIRHSIHKEHQTEIMFFMQDSSPVSQKDARSIEKIYFQEKFRREKCHGIGKVTKNTQLKERYFNEINKHINMEDDHKKPYIAADLMHGMISDIYPEILRKLDIENIMLNAYLNEQKLVRISKEADKNLKVLSKIVKNLKMDLGFAIYPNAQKVDFISDKGEIVRPDRVLMAFIYLLHILNNRIYKIYLPSWAPEIFDERFENIAITRGKFMGKNEAFLRSFDFIGDTSGNYVFTDFGIHPDGVFASIKMMELLYRAEKSLSEILNEIPDYAFRHIKISVPSNKKGTVMRNFILEAKDNRVSHLDGIKIYLSNLDWVLMIPDDYDELVHLYIQAENEEKLNEIKDEFVHKIESWV
jgi:mannose-1-phosphate guanylyltransferase/phosphomannomutase